MDGGKAVCLTARNEIDLWDFEWEEPPAEIAPDKAFPALITIPTTAGTGAETESTAMITDTVKGHEILHLPSRAEAVPGASGS